MTTDWKRGDNLKDPCPLCGGILVVRQNKSDGGLFVGCRSFPSCRMNRPIRTGDEREGGQWDHDSSPVAGGARTDYLCAECREPQRNTPGGLVCRNGHGGAGSIDPNTGEVVDKGYDDLPPDEPEDDPDPFAEPAQTMELETVDPDMAAIEEAAAEAGVPREDYDGPTDIDYQAGDDLAMLTGHKAEELVEGYRKHFVEGYRKHGVLMGVKEEGQVDPNHVPSFEETYETADHMIVFTVELRSVDRKKVYSSAEATFAFDLEATKRRMAAGTDSPVEIVGKMLTYLVRSVKAVLLK